MFSVKMWLVNFQNVAPFSKNRFWFQNLYKWIVLCFYLLRILKKIYALILNFTITKKNNNNNKNWKTVEIKTLNLVWAIFSWCFNDPPNISQRGRAGRFHIKRLQCPLDSFKENYLNEKNLQDSWTGRVVHLWVKGHQSFLIPFGRYGTYGSPEDSCLIFEFLGMVNNYEAPFKTFKNELNKAI